MPVPKTKPVGQPAAPIIQAVLERVDTGLFTRHSRWDDVELVDPDLALVEATEPRLSCIRIDGGDVGEGRLIHMTIADSELRRLNAANVKAEGAVIGRTRLHAVRLTGADLTLSDLRDVSFTDCRADFASFNRARVQDAEFVGCDLRDVDFGGARLDRVRFERCDLSLADWAGAELRRCEMRGCTLEGAKGVASLSGVAMPWPDIVENAAVFAGALGITVISEDAPAR